VQSRSKQRLEDMTIRFEEQSAYERRYFDPVQQGIETWQCLVTDNLFVQLERERG
jgi:hypothetical protein